MAECNYRGSVLTLVAKTLTLKPGEVNHLEIRHDDWCPVVGGDGHAECQPAFFVGDKEVKL